MRRRTAIAPVLAAVALALLLILYVFADGTSRAEKSDRPRCSSKASLDAVRNELLDRVGARRASDGMFAAVRTYSVMHPKSQLSRRLSAGSETVKCNGRLLLALPPGVLTVDGRPNIEAEVEYELSRGPNGSPRLEALRHADAMIAAVATIGTNQPPTPQVGPPQGVEGLEGLAPARRGEMAPPSPVSATSSARRAQPNEPSRVSATPMRGKLPASQRKADRGAGVPVSTPEPPRASPATVASRSTPPVPPSPSALDATPSFNCRFARRSSERAVCRDPRLASLDRQMAAQFFSALDHARPGQRAMLQRTRNQFLRYRESCRSTACIAAAYQQRMREINDIMAGAW